MQDGANIYWKAYENDQEWRFLGKTPLSPVRLPKGILQIKIEKEGYETALLSISNPSMRLDNFPIYVPWKLDPINLQPLGSVPNGMVYIQGGDFIPGLTGNGTDPVYLHPFYIDKYEVTNKEYKKFMESGGYDNSQYWVDMEFIQDGVSLSLKAVSYTHLRAHET